MDEVHAEELGYIWDDYTKKRIDEIVIRIRLDPLKTNVNKNSNINNENINVNQSQNDSGEEDDDIDNIDDIEQFQKANDMIIKQEENNNVQNVVFNENQNNSSQQPSTNNNNGNDTSIGYGNNGYNYDNGNNMNEFDPISQNITNINVC